MNPPHASLPGDCARKYEMEKPLAAGGFGQVVLARQRDLDRRVVIKLMHAHLAAGDERARFVEEARITSSLKHPGIVTVYDHGVDESTPWIAYEFIEGASLRDLMENRPPTLAAAVEIVRQVAQALEFAHSRGIVHRDIKPENILLTKAGVPKITDFGIAKWGGGGVKTEAGMIMGTPAYLAPEYIRGEGAGGATDMYALGVILYELLAGQRPFPGDNPTSLIERHLREEPPSVRTLAPGTPPALESLVKALLAKDPGDRPDARTLAEELGRATGTLDGSLMTGRSTSRSARTSALNRRPGARSESSTRISRIQDTTRPKSRGILAALAALGSIGVIFVTSWLRTPADSTPPRPSSPVPASPDLTPVLPSWSHVESKVVETLLEEGPADELPEWLQRVAESAQDVDQIRVLLPLVCWYSGVRAGETLLGLWRRGTAPGTRLTAIEKLQWTFCLGQQAGSHARQPLAEMLTAPPMNDPGYLDPLGRKAGKFLSTPRSVDAALRALGEAEMHRRFDHWGLGGEDATSAKVKQRLADWPVDNLAAQGDAFGHQVLAILAFGAPGDDVTAQRLLTHCRVHQSWLVIDAFNLRGMTDDFGITGASLELDKQEYMQHSTHSPENKKQLDGFLADMKSAPSGSRGLFILNPGHPWPLNTRLVSRPGDRWQIRASGFRTRMISGTELIREGTHWIEAMRYTTTLPGEPGLESLHVRIGSHGATFAADPGKRTFEGVVESPREGALMLSPAPFPRTAQQIRAAHQVDPYPGVGWLMVQVSRLSPP